MGDKMKYYLYMGALKPLSWLPFPVLYAISDFLYWVVYRVMKYRLKVVRDNLEACFPEKGEEELRAIEKEFYRYFCDNIVEAVKLLSISDRQVERRMEVVGASLVEEIASQGKPVFLYLGHYGNWEWAPSIALHYSIPKVSAQIYKPLRDKAFDRVMLKVRSRFHSLSIPQHSAMRTFLKLKRDEGTFIVGIIDDNRPNHERFPHYMSFLNHQETLYSVGGEEIGRRLGAGFLYLDVERVSRGHYRFTFKEIVPDGNENEYPYTQKYMKMLEATIRRAPAYWLWSHRRWHRLKKKNKNQNQK